MTILLLCKADIEARYQRLLARRTGGDPVAMAAEDRAISLRVHAASRDVDHAPTPAQLEAGNYRKHRLQFQGLDITIENPRGSIRRGVDRGGHEWATSMQHHYGYIRGTLGVDRDHFDCLVGPNPAAPMVYVVTTMAPPAFTATDEQKALLGFNSEEEARTAFAGMYDDPRFFGSVAEMPVAEFKRQVLTTRENPRLLKARVLFFKAQVAGGTAGDLLAMPVTVAAHTRGDGSVVQAYTAVRHVAAPAPKPGHGAPPVTSFRSGASAPADFRGYMLANKPVGVSLAEIGPRSATWPMIASYAKAGGQVFVDSGAFPTFTKNLPPVDFDRVLEMYRQLADAAGAGRLHLVMPDVIGDQVATFSILDRYRDQVRDLIDRGHDALVAVQKGDMPPYDAWRTTVGILGTDNFTVAVPSNEVAFDLDDVANLFGGPEKPKRVHLLGIAGNAEKLGRLVKAIHTRAPDCIITSDANRLRAKVGEGRAVTEETARQVKRLGEDQWNGGIEGMRAFDITELMGRVAYDTNWLRPDQVRQLAADLGVTDPAEQRKWVAAHRSDGLAELLDEVDSDGRMTEHAVRSMFKKGAEQAVRSAARSTAIATDENRETAQQDLFAWGSPRVS